jgi:hypothetical protein
LRCHLADDFSLSVTALGEFAAGFANTTDETFVAVKAHFKLRPVDDADAWHYREIFRFLKERGNSSAQTICGSPPPRLNTANL